MKTNQNYSLQFLIRTAKSKNGRAPIYCRIAVNGKRAEISLKKYVDPKKWIPSVGMVKGNSEEAKVINHQIDLLKIEINKHYNKLLGAGKSITAETIKNSLLGAGEIERTLVEVFRYHNAQIKQRIGVDVVRATHTKFETILSKVEMFLKKYLRCSDIRLQEINHKFATDFEHFLKVDQHISHNTTMKYIRCLKKILNMAVANDWITKNPLNQFKCSLVTVIREALTEEELSVMQKKDFSIERLAEVRDIFLFCCYTGYAFADVAKLTPKDITIGIDGNKWIFTNRKKTGTVSNVPLLAQAHDIIKKYSDNEYCLASNKLLPVKSNQKMNAYLKEVADLCGIKKHLTMHIARHTFATTVTLSNGVPIETVSKMLGHTKLATTQIYAKVLENKVSHDMQQLQKKLSQKTKTAKKSTGT